MMIQLARAWFRVTRGDFGTMRETGNPGSEKVDRILEYGGAIE